jgi:hypothetical protein
MFKIDNRRADGDTTNMLLSNISEQLAEIISLLKPQKTNEMERSQGIETQPEEFGFKCKCGKEFEKKRQLTAHKIKCKNKG